MAQSRGRKTSSGKKSNTSSRKKKKNIQQYENTIIDEVFFLLSLAITILLFLCNFHIIGTLGNILSSFMFGLFGYMAYVAPLLIFFCVCFWIANLGNPVATIKLISGFVLFCMLCVCFTLIGGIANIGSSISDFYHFSADNLKGGGIIGGFLGNGMYQMLGMVGTVIILIVLILICIVLLTEHSFRNKIKNGGAILADYVKDDFQRKREYAQERNDERMLQREKRKEEQRLQAEADKELRMNKKVSGIANASELNIKPVKTTAAGRQTQPVDMEELSQKVLKEQAEADKSQAMEALSKIRIRGIDDSNIGDVSTRELGPEIGQKKNSPEADAAAPAPVRERKADSKSRMTESASENTAAAYPAQPVYQEKKAADTAQTKAEEPVSIEPQPVKLKAKYKFPPVDKLTPGKKKTAGDNGQSLRETALRLQDTLRTFGVNVTVTDISQGPAVTRYELQPEVGVKVSKIVNLADDIKLNLAATDIRIEAPIPGKAAVGIEVPNAENSMVAFRDLIDSPEFKKAESKISFAVGKDIGGNTVIADLAKMPHLLIAGATGSGKSVCINTIIMSILYKSSPDDVKLILIDPKVVELSVYNGIPHLMIPVVTDPKKAAAALHWGVAEMEDRYKKFAELNVRDLKGYNKKVREMTENNGQPIPQELPQILIIVDELADLMMVASNEVEESICRLAQLARACGIHLVIATQRPSVDVITGLIKANMPSRIAFAVSSGVDSRTILDMVGAEKLLGKGDMLFYPQGKTKPERVQGAFVSDQEVSEVVDFIKEQNLGNTYTSDVEEKISNITSASMKDGGFTDSASDRDQYFVDAGNFIIDKEKASIGMLQRVFKIGFNRAARIMDQLEEAGVVGPEEGTKPRRVLMSKEQFLQLQEDDV